MSSEVCAQPIDADAIAAYLARALAPDELEALERHVDGCAACRWLVYAAMRGGASEDAGASKAPDDASDDGALPHGRRIGRFCVDRPLGAGGMGTVYLAEDVGLGRVVALKAVRDARGDAAQLRGEAQAMAKVSHPNVTAVYDVVEHRGAVYVAMEYVDGATLDAWLARPMHRMRPVGTVIDAVIAAGEGLAAVHAAGLVHGDVKPRNILVGRDGRVRITDFGLARLATEGDGRRRGTPAYLAPELERGAPASAASDQYALCLALREAIGERGPLAVHAILARGLADDPDARYPSVAALVDELRRATAPRWRSRAWLVAGAALALAGLTAFRAARDHAQLAACEAGVPTAPWTLAARTSVEAALRATGVAYAGDAWRGVDRALSRWARDYDGERAAACRATWIDHAQPQPQLAARLGCLADRARETRALVDALAHADRAVAANAVVAAAASSPHGCAEPAVVLHPARRPRDPVLGLRVDAIRGALAEVQALDDVGRYRRGIAVGQAALAAAEATGFTPVIAEAALALGSVQIGEPPAAATLLRAALLGDELGDDALRGRAWTRLIRADYEVGKTDRLALARAQATAALARAHAPPLVEAVLHHEAGTALLDRNELDAGEQELRRALALREAEGEAARYAVARTRKSLAIARAMRGETRDAVALLRHALAILEGELGARHPQIAGMHLVLGQVLRADLQAAAAVDELARAVALAGDDRALRAAATSSLGLALLDTGDATRALAAASDARDQLRALRPDHPRLAFALLGIGQAQLALGHPADAVATLEDALRVRTPGRDDAAAIQLALAEALGDDARPRARALARAALASYDRSAPDPHTRHSRDRARAWLAAHPAP